MDSIEIREEYTAEEVVLQLRLLFKNLGVQKPSEETLQQIKEVIEKDGTNKITHI